MASEQYNEFTLFPSLPAEIRLQIWREACHERVVEVMYKPEHDKVVTTTDPPAVLHVNAESRTECLRFYIKSFMTSTQEPHIYFCPGRDTLYLPRHRDMGYDDAARDFCTHVLDTSHVCSLAIDHVRPDIIRPWEPYNKFWLIHSFPSLMEVVLVIGSDPQTRRNDTHADIEFIDPVTDPASVHRILDDVKESFVHDAVFAAANNNDGDFIDCPLVAKSKVTRDHSTHSIACH